MCVNRRGYPDSTPLSEAECNDVTNGDEQKWQAFTTARGVEIAIFVDEFIRHNGTPPRIDGEPTGGYVLVGWSLGVGFAVYPLDNLHFRQTHRCG